MSEKLDVSDMPIYPSECLAHQDFRRPAPYRLLELAFCTPNEKTNRVANLADREPSVPDVIRDYVSSYML